MNVAQAQTVKFTPLMASFTVRGANFGPNTRICKALKACGVYYFPEWPKAFIPPEVFSRDDSQYRSFFAYPHEQSTRV